MNYIKLFEELTIDDLEVGDYVVCEVEDNETGSDINWFFTSNIGELIRKRNHMVLFS